MSLIESVFRNHTGRLIDKWEHYFPVYERHFRKFVGHSPTVLEIGVSHGGSLQMWREYFGPGSHIIGVDIDPRCIQYQEAGIQIVTADQRTPALADLGPFDIVIDDGSHVIGDIEATFHNLFPVTKSVYLIEDLHGDYPDLQLKSVTPIIGYTYPWVVVVERAKRIIKGKPSRPLTDAESTAILLQTAKDLT